MEWDRGGLGGVIRFDWRKTKTINSSDPEPHYYCKEPPSRCFYISCMGRHVLLFFKGKWVKSVCRMMFYSSFINLRSISFNFT